MIFLRYRYKSMLSAPNTDPLNADRLHFVWSSIAPATAYEPYIALLMFNLHVNTNHPIPSEPLDLIELNVDPVYRIKHCVIPSLTAMSGSIYWAVFWCWYFITMAGLSPSHKPLRLCLYSNIHVYRFDAVPWSLHMHLYEFKCLRA
jgi:hypothetical protein